ncbi:hypothetical protein G5B37_03420 [Rasiella rasia]|uniref:NERD domain-containing protein n=1 Tax=Rasiella rasia TaxID=2744027 RepID=A0A6G6GJB3_9FLAO|nr:hypothetical protein [Rasiella rasia]QIE58642.1 hypothetical protein G5B37_03420 [Rasiella rasia]
MSLENKIEELKEIVSKYDLESFAGFFAFFLKKRPDSSSEIKLNKFKSKFKDFFYLIALHAFSDNKKGDEIFELSEKLIGELAERVNAIKDYNLEESSSDYTLESVIHEMAYRSHFDNGVLSYVEQDLERIKTIFHPFEKKINDDFGLDIHFLVEIYKHIELISINRFNEVTEFLQTKEFIEFNRRTQEKEISFSEAFILLPKKTQESFSSFQLKPHTFLMFTKEDLYLTFSKEKVDKFLKLFSCEPNPNINFNYYTEDNPFELKPILKLSDNNYLNLFQKQIPVAIYRHLYSHLLKDKKLYNKIRKHRENSLERKTIEIFKSIFPSKGSFFYENYYILNNFEQDLLIIYKGHAIIVESKASKLREPFRNVEKAVTRLKNDFKSSIQYGYDQCKRVEDYFLGSETFSIKDNKNRVLFKVNPNKIHSVYSIVVTLERFGNLQTDLGLMLQKNDKKKYPWSVYINDLEIFFLTLKYHTSNSLNNLFSFLKLRREMHNHLYAIDELDICAAFIRSPKKFKKFTKMNDTLLSFSPLEQELFDQYYYAGKLQFKEQPLPDDFLKLGIEKMGSRS